MSKQVTGKGDIIMAKKTSKNHKAIVTESKYQGQYVAFSSSKDNKIIASGRKAGTVIQKARKQGEQTPTIIFVPKENATYIY